MGSLTISADEISRLSLICIWQTATLQCSEIWVEFVLVWNGLSWGRYIKFKLFHSGKDVCGSHKLNPPPPPSIYHLKLSTKCIINNIVHFISLSCRDLKRLEVEVPKVEGVVSQAKQELKQVVNSETQCQEKVCSKLIVRNNRLIDFKTADWFK